MSRSLPLISLAAALALASCNKAPETTDNALVDVANAEDADDADFDEAPAIENVADAGTEAVTIVAVPKPAAKTADTAPLVEASDIEDEIRSGTGIQRIRYGQGWAWTRGGRIVRTADRDGRNVAYFRGGEDRPFFVQRGDRASAYNGDRPVREFDRDGRGRAPDAERARDAEQAAREARERRQRAEEARGRARPGRGFGDDRDDHRGRDRPTPTPTASPTPSPSPSPTATPRGRDRDRDGRPDWRNRPTPSPQGGGRPRPERN